MKNENVFVVVELVQECNKEKTVTGVKVFTTKEMAEKHLHERYLDVRLHIDQSSGEFSSDCDKDWYICVDNDGDCYEGILTDSSVDDDTLIKEADYAKD